MLPIYKPIALQHNKTIMVSIQLPCFSLNYMCCFRCRGPFIYSTMAHLGRRLLFFACSMALVGRIVDGCPNAALPQGCNCQSETQKIVQCTGLSEIPKLPDDTQDVLLISCKFPKIGGPNVLRYTSSKLLQITNSEITTIEDDAFFHMPRLKQLDLSGNAISNISSRTFSNIQQLVQLDLSRNRLSRLQADVFKNLKALEIITLVGNEMDSLPGDIFKSSPGLHSIHIDDNKFSDVPSAVKNVINLKTLNLAMNPIGDLRANMFEELANLTQLDMSSCGINVIDDNAFAGLTSLQLLRLERNNLKQLTPKAMAPMQKSLKRVMLAGNKLTTLEEGTLPTGGTLRELTIGKNPWHCDKRIVWLKDLLLEKIDHENITCKTPPRLSGILLQNITKSMLEVEENGMRSMIAAAVAIPIIAICVLVIFFIVYKIVQSRRQQKRASFRYSAVYRDTVESAHRPPKHRPVSEI